MVLWFYGRSTASIKNMLFTVDEAKVSSQNMVVSDVAQVSYLCGQERLLP